MKPFPLFLTLAANNEAEALLANASDGGGVFAILQGDSFFVPYGEYPHKTGLQVVDRTAAEMMAANQKGVFRRILGVVAGNSAGFPVYIGHPDLPGSKDTDKRSWGWITDIVPEETGIRFPVKMSEPGAELIANAHFKFYSPLWWHKPLGKGRVRPVALKSMGLTNDPNIPVPALANEAEGEHSTSNAEHTTLKEEEEENPAPNEIMNPELLAALGLEEGAAPESVLAKITEIQSAATAANERITETETELATANGKITELESFKKRGLEAETMLSEAEAATTAANEKVTVLEGDLSGAITAHVMQASLLGRITPAEVQATVERIIAANDKPAELTALYNLPAKVKTESVTGDLGAAKSRLVVAANDESAAKRNERALLVANEYAATNPALSEGERKRIAWQRAQKKNPEIFGAKKDSSGTAA